MARDRVRSLSNVKVPAAPATYDLADQAHLRRVLETHTHRAAAQNDIFAEEYDNDLQECIDRASVRGGGRVLLAPGVTYTVGASLVLKDGVSILGQQAFELLGDNPPSITAANGMTTPIFTLDTGVVQNIDIGGFVLLANSANIGQRAIQIDAVAEMEGGVLQGGLWFFRFHDIYVRDFDAESCWLHGGDDANNAPIQFGSFERVSMSSLSTTTSTLRMSGMVGQIRFDEGCRINGPGKDLGTVNILVERTVNSAGANNGDRAPYSINFFGTSEENTRLITIERAQQFNVFGAHFELASQGISVDLSATMTTIQGCDFENVGDGGGTGWAVKSAGGATCVVGNNSFYGACDKHYYGNGVFGNLFMFGYHVFTNPARPIVTSGISGAGIATPVFVTTTGTIDATAGSELYDVTGGSITRTLSLTPGVPAGTTIALKKYDGTANTVSIVNADSTTYVLRRGNQAIIAQWDGAAWKVLSMSTPVIPSVVAQFGNASTSAAAGVGTTFGWASAADYNTSQNLVNALQAACLAAGIIR